MADNNLVASNAMQLSAQSRIDSVGGLGLAGLIGGPLAVFYLIYRNLQLLGLRDRIPVAAAWFVPLVAVWLYFILSVPPDILSQLIPIFPQAVLWWLVIRHILGKSINVYRSKGRES